MHTLAEAAGKALGGSLPACMLAAPPEPGRTPGCLVLYRRGQAAANALFAQGQRALASRLQREQQVLGGLWREVPYPIVGAIPRALGTARYGNDGRVALQSAPRGGSLARYLGGNPRRLERVLDLGLDWLSRFHRWQHGLEGGEPSPGPRASHQAEPVLGALGRAGLRLSGAAVSRVSECFRRLGTGAAQHGSFTPRNVHWAGGRRVWVIGWGDYARVHEPLYDALDYCTGAGLACLGEAKPASLWDLYFSPSPMARLIAMGVRRVADMAGVPGPFYPHLVAYLAQRAARALQPLGLAEGEPGAAAWLALLEEAVDREELVVDGKRTV